MPETGIGLFPDVGATYVLPRLPRRARHVPRASPARGSAPPTACAPGIGSCYVPSGRLEALEDALAEADLTGDAHARVQIACSHDFRTDPGAGRRLLQQMRPDRRLLRPERPWRGAAALGAEETGWGAGAARAAVDRKSPTSLAVTFRQLQEGRGARLR